MGSQEMAFNEALTRVLQKPIPDSLWQLKLTLLAGGIADSSVIMEVVDHFFKFVNELAASATSREFSHFASLLDLGAVGGVAVQNLMEAGLSENWSQRLLVGGLSETLMVFAARQYVKAWEQEMQAAFRAAGYYLAGAFWRLSAETQPELPPEKRRQLIDHLLAPLNSEEHKGTVMAAVIVHYYQLLLLSQFKQELLSS